MARVTIDSGAITADLRLRNVPPDKWHALMLSRRTFLHTHLPYDCRELLRFVHEAEEMYAALGFANVEDFVRRGFELEPDQVAWAIEGLRQFKPNEPIPYQRAITLGQRAQATDAKDRENLRPAGGDRRSEEYRAKRAQEIDARDRASLRPAGQTKLYNNEANVQVDKAPTGNSAAAFLRRLRRDRPDIHARVLAGELSPHAGMVEAGFRKKTVRKKLTRIGKAQRIVDQMTKAEFIDFKLWINRRK